MTIAVSLILPPFRLKCREKPCLVIQDIGSVSRVPESFRTDPVENFSCYYWKAPEIAFVCTTLMAATETPIKLMTSEWYSL